MLRNFHRRALFFPKLVVPSANPFFHIRSFAVYRSDLDLSPCEVQLKEPLPRKNRHNSSSDSCTEQISAKRESIRRLLAQNSGQDKPALSRANTQFKMRDYGLEISQALKAPSRGESQSFRLEPGEVKAKLIALGLGFKDSGDQVQVEWCPICPKPHNN